MSYLFLFIVYKTRTSISGGMEPFSLFLSHFEYRAHFCTYFSSTAIQKIHMQIVIKKISSRTTGWEHLV